MKTFIQYINESTPQTHSTHLADTFILQKQEGIKKIISSLNYIVKTIGFENPPIGTKIDGSPHIVFGWINNRFFVGTKSIYSKKEPKAYFSEIDINRAEIPSELKDKLKIAHQYLSKVTSKSSKDIWAGDVLFTSGSLKQKTIDGIDYITFHPNTLMYAVAKDDPLYKKIVSSKIGIAVHTQLEITDPSELRSIKHKSFGVRKESFKESKDVFLIDTYPKNVSKELSFSPQEKSNYGKLMSIVKRVGNKIDYSILDQTKVKQYFFSYTNSYVRDRKLLKPEEMVQKFIDFIDKKVPSKIASF